MLEHGSGANWGELVTLVLRYSAALGFSGAPGLSTMLRYAVAGQVNAFGSSAATLSTNCDARTVLQLALIVGASVTPMPDERGNAAPLRRTEADVSRQPPNP